MKKFYFLIFPCFFILMSASVFSQLLFTDGFESGNMLNWTASGDTLVSTVSPSEGSYCYQGTNSYQMQKTFSAISKDVIIINQVNQYYDIVKEGYSRLKNNAMCIDFSFEQDVWQMIYVIVELYN